MSNVNKPSMDQPPPEKATGGEYTKDNVAAYLLDELSDLREGWDQAFETPPAGRPEDWKDQLAHIERAVADIRKKIS